MGFDGDAVTDFSGESNKTLEYRTWAALKGRGPSQLLKSKISSLSKLYRLPGENSGNTNAFSGKILFCLCPVGLITFWNCLSLSIRYQGTADDCSAWTPTLLNTSIR